MAGRPYGQTSAHRLQQAVPRFIVRGSSGCSVFGASQGDRGARLAPRTRVMAIVAMARPMTSARIESEVSRLFPLVVGVGLALTACSHGDDSGNMSAAQAKAVCLRQAAGVADASDVHAALTRKHDRYWHVALGVIPPDNVVWCTVNAVNGDVVHWTHGFTRSAAKDVLRGGARDNKAQ
jgi:hypothetical protein